MNTATTLTSPVQNKTRRFPTWAKIALAVLLLLVVAAAALAGVLLSVEPSLAQTPTESEFVGTIRTPLGDPVQRAAVTLHDLAGVFGDVDLDSDERLRRASPRESLQMLAASEPAANRIANTVGVSFVQERERVIRQQQEAIRELSTPVLQVRERLVILPIIGALDSQRARQLTEQLLRAIRTNRAQVVVIDITGVPEIDSTVANHLVQTVDASRLMGASVIITGLSAEIALTLVTIGVDLSKMNAVGDLQGGIEVAERMLGYEVTRSQPLSPSAELR